MNSEVVALVGTLLSVLVKYGPSALAAAVKLLSKQSVKPEDFDELILSVKSYDDYIKVKGGN